MLSTPIAGAPLSLWIGFHLFLLALVVLDLFLFKAGSPAHKTRRALLLTGLWIAAALAFAFVVRYFLGHGTTVEFITAYLVEESLSVDNLFVFLILFAQFEITEHHQHKVLFWGVAGAIVMRAAFIAGGVALLDRLEWITYVFGLLLLFAAVRLVLPQHKKKKSEARWLAWLRNHLPLTTQPHKGHFTLRENGRRRFTTLFLVLIAIELTDILFAVDSVPAVLSISRHPFVVYTSNVLAVMGMRSLYFALAGALTKLHLLHYGLAAILGFVAAKMLLAHWIEIPALISLVVILVILGICTAASLLFPKVEAPAHHNAT